MPALATPSVLPKAKLFRGFSEPSRLSIIEVLRQGEMTVTDICQATGLTQPNASNHLACLLGCRLLRREQRGRFAYYRLADERVEALLALGDEISSGLSTDGPCCPVCGSSVPE